VLLYLVFISLGERNLESKSHLPREIAFSSTKLITYPLVICSILMFSSCDAFAKEKLVTISYSSKSVGVSDVRFLNILRNLPLRDEDKLCVISEAGFMLFWPMNVDLYSEDGNNPFLIQDFQSAVDTSSVNCCSILIINTGWEDEYS
jgi:hypothetical protein